jgi:hypothetical protein
MKGNYNLPKYRKGNKVNTPQGEGVITMITYEGGANWYRVNNTFYSENEITKI